MKKSIVFSAIISLFVALAMTTSVRAQDSSRFFQPQIDDEVLVEGNHVMAWDNVVNIPWDDVAAEDPVYYAVELLRATTAGIPGAFAGAGAISLIAELATEGAEFTLKLASVAPPGTP